jgi:UrcA family protein
MRVDLRSETLTPERGVQRIADPHRTRITSGVTVMKTRYLNPVSVIFAAGLTLAPIAGICADPAPQARVSVADVDLSSPQGIATLYGRLRRAAAYVCGDEPQNRELSRHASWSNCVGTALDGAVVQVHSAGLAALHAQRLGRRLPLLVAKGTPEER